MMTEIIIGSIDLARSLCVEIAGLNDDLDNDIDGEQYGSVDVAKILSAEVVRLRARVKELEETLSKKPILTMHSFYSNNTHKYYLDESEAIDAGNAHAVYTAHLPNPPKD